MMTAFARRAGTAGLVCLLVAFSGAAAHAQQARALYPLDTLSPKSDITRWFVSIFWNVTIWDSIILLVVVVALFLAIFVFSSRTGEPGVSSTKESDMYLELAWTVIPSLILVAITVPTVKAIIATQPDRWPAETLPIRVIAHQWWWEFNYPTLGVETGDEFHIPTGRQVHFEMVSKDVIHSFFMPAIGGKRDVVPGQTNQITLKADVPGEYWGQCTEFCGDSHANMRFRVFVDTPENFDKWVKHQLEGPVKPPPDSAAAAGAKIFADAPCAICHSIKGISGFSKSYTFGFRGPDLTHFGSRGTMAGSMYDNTPENVANWIKDPDKMKPGANMPTLGLKGKDLNDLVAYLESLK
jgi:cytochrome c oxidase subunit 2